MDSVQIGSQIALTWKVFASRLLPLLSYDMMSNVAGFGYLSTWRFALATFTEITPASVVLALLGDEAERY